MKVGVRRRDKKRGHLCLLDIHPPQRQTRRESEIITEKERVMMWLIAAGCERFTKLPPTVFQHQTNIRPLICENPIKPAERTYKQGDILFPTHSAFSCF